MDLPRRTVRDSNRFAFGNDGSVYTATTLGLVLWVASTYWFKKSYFAKDKNLFNWGLFTVGSLFSSVAIARFLVESPVAAAARRNNFNEYKH